MRRTRTLLLAAAMVAAFVVPSGGASAATTVSYRLSGTASASLFPTVEMSGSAKARTGKGSGTWSASFGQDLGAILGGTFTFTSKARSFSGAITGGTFGPGTGSCAKSVLPVHGVIAGGSSFDVTLTRYGSLVNGSCLVSSSTVTGTATLVYP